MLKNIPVPKSTQQLLAELTEVRDAARVRLHLLSMEARQRWQRLETALEALESKLCSQSEGASESVRKSVRESIQAVKEFLKHESRGRPESPPASNR